MSMRLLIIRHGQSLSVVPADDEQILEAGSPALHGRPFYTCNLFCSKPKNSEEFNRLK
jgi:hypothetical protein